ncbi:MAG: methyltransferase domain-containing protein [Hyphomicrobiales bacterium]|nr:methyltransferase domain-containing protein [Hyphomicrobiales bacterium]
MPTHVAPFLPDRFRSAVPYYVEGRLDYPPRLIGNLAAWLGITKDARVLDLGCGPGFLAMAFAELGCATVGIDPDKAMLAAAKDLASKRGVDCEFREGSSYDLSPALGCFKLVTMGRSFHWMDREATLATLDTVVEPGGAVALFHDHHIKCRENRWVEAFEGARSRFEHRDEFTKRRQSGEIDAHATMLLNSSFSCLDMMGMIERRRITLDGLVSRALSFSASSPEKLGKQRQQYEAAVRDAVTPFAESGALMELVEFSALVARRPKA